MVIAKSAPSGPRPVFKFRWNQYDGAEGGFDFAHPIPNESNNLCLSRKHLRYQPIKNSIRNGKSDTPFFDPLVAELVAPTLARAHHCWGYSSILTLGQAHSDALWSSHINLRRVSLPEIVVRDCQGLVPAFSLFQPRPLVTFFSVHRRPAAALLVFLARTTWARIVAPDLGGVAT
jgi:hypothetical protein